MLAIQIEEQKYFSYYYQGRRYSGGQIIRKPQALTLEALDPQPITREEFLALPKFNNIFAAAGAAQINRLFPLGA